MRIISLLGLTFLLGAASVALAQSGDPISVTPLTNIGLASSTPADIGGFINELYRYGIGVGAIAAVLVLIFGGFKYMTSQAPGGKSDGRDAITRAILGLLLLLSPFIVFSVINSDITRFNLDLSFGGNVGGNPTELGTGEGTQTQCEQIESMWNESRENIIAPDRDSHLPTREQISDNGLSSCCTFSGGAIKVETKTVRGSDRTYNEVSCDYRETRIVVNADIIFNDGSTLESEGTGDLVGRVRTGLCDNIDSDDGTSWADNKVGELFTAGVLEFTNQAGRKVANETEDSGLSVERFEIIGGTNSVTCGSPIF